MVSVIHWRPDRSYTRRFHKDHIFRSICRIKGSKLVASDQPMLSNRVDVLFTMHLCSMNYPANPALLKPAAESFLRFGVLNYQTNGY